MSTKKHRWYKPGASHRGGSRRCIDCGVRRRVKPGTRLTWQYRMAAGAVWQPKFACFVPAKPKTLGVG